MKCTYEFKNTSLNGQSNITVYLCHSIDCGQLFSVLQFISNLFQRHAIRTLVQIAKYYLCCNIELKPYEKLQWRLFMRKWKARTRRRPSNASSFMLFFLFICIFYSRFFFRKCPDAFCSTLFHLHVARCIGHSSRLK